ncbi:MAG: sulfatase-like hydrolase/transferase [Thalassotalea sp.]
MKKALSFVVLSATCLITLQPVLATDKTVNKSQQPNILWIVTDDQRADSIAAFNQVERGENNSALGYVASPNIDALAKEGVLFTRAYNNSPACASSRASMVMGLYPHHGGRYGFEYSNNTHALSTPSLPGVLNSKGYQTLLIGKRGIRIKAWNTVDGADGFYQQIIDKDRDLAKAGLTDFESKTVWQDKKQYGRKETFFLADGSQNDFWLQKRDQKNTGQNPIDQHYDILRAYKRSNTRLILGGVSPKPAGETIDGYIGSSFSEYLSHPDQSYQAQFNRKMQGPDTNKPIMVNLGFHFPHTPVLPPQSFREQFKDKVYQIPSFNKAELKLMPPQLVKLYEKMNMADMKPADKQQAIRDYYAFCAYGDSLVGQAIKDFKAYNQKHGQEYLIVMTVGDHGWHLGEQGIEAKFSPWNTANQGVMIVSDSRKKSSAFKAGSVYADFIEYVDIAPTIMSAAGVDVKKEQPHFDGLNLAEVVTQPHLKRDYVIGELNHVVGPRAYLRSERYSISMRVRKQDTKPGGQEKQSYQPGEDIQWAIKATDKQVELALYDLKCDANEQNNLANNSAYQGVKDYYRNKLQNIVLGDGRVEVDWQKPEQYYVSDFAKGAHDFKLKPFDNIRCN